MRIRIVSHHKLVYYPSENSGYLFTLDTPTQSESLYHIQALRSINYGYMYTKDECQRYAAILYCVRHTQKATCVWNPNEKTCVPSTMPCIKDPKPIIIYLSARTLDGTHNNTIVYRWCPFRALRSDVSPLFFSAVVSNNAYLSDAISLESLLLTRNPIAIREERIIYVHITHTDLAGQYVLPTSITCNMRVVL